MKNILDEKPLPYDSLFGRLKYSCDFVREEDLNGKTILNIGCGFGWFELFCLYKNASRVHSIEIDEQSIATARRNISDPKISFSVASALDLPFPNGTFDTIVCWEVLEHIPKNTEGRMFSEIFRVLKPRGQFYMSTPNRSFLSTVFDPAWWLIGHRHYSEKQIRRIANQSGLRVNSLTRKGGKWEIIGWWNLYISKWIFRRRSFFEKLVSRKITQEFYNRRMGYTNLFVHFERPKDSYASTK